MLMVTESNNVLNFEVLTVVVVKPAVCLFVKPCGVVEMTSVSEDPTIAVSRLENEDIRFLRNVGTFCHSTSHFTAMRPSSAKVEKCTGIPYMVHGTHPSNLS
jgi:hypothetical protein